MDACEEFIEIFTTNFPFRDIERKGRQYYLSSAKQKAILEGIPEDSVSQGLFLGEKTARGFVPTPGLIELVAKNTNRKITITEKSAWLFICGRDVFQENIVIEKSNLQSKDVIVLNEEDEVLGFARRAKRW